MNKIAFIFSGQGAQTVGMGKELAENFKCADEIFNKASDALGFDIKKMIWEGDDETLKITKNTQPSIVTVSMAAYSILKEKGITPSVVAGLSLGEYSAHIASGTLSFTDGVKLVRKRGKYMQDAVPVGVGGMGVILAMSEDDVYKLCKKASEKGIVEPANFNCPGQITVAGEIEAVEYALSLAKEMGAKRAMLLPVSAPFHCSMLVSAGEKLAEELEKITFFDMKIPVITNVTADYVKTTDEAKDYFIKQVSSSVLWEKSIRRMIDDGIDCFVELGPGKALSGFVKKINSDVEIYNVEDMASLAITLEGLGKDA